MEKLKQKFDIEIKFVHFPLHPETPDEGLSLEQLFAGRGYDIEAAKQRLTGLMEQEGLPYGDRTHTYNSRLAQEVGKWAEGQPGEEKLHELLFQAYFVENHNIANLDVLMNVVHAAGMDAVDAREKMRERAFSDAVEADWQRSREIGVTGVPTFVVGGYAVVGAQPLEALESLLEKVGAARKEPAGT